MDVKYLFVGLFLLLMDNLKFGSGGFPMQCPLYQLRFQKIIGYRPPMELATMQNQIITDADKDETLNFNCLKYCQNDEDCSSYIYLMDKKECYGFTRIEKSTKYKYIPADIDLVSDPNAIYFEKTCLTVPDYCKLKLWPITKIPGSSLIFQGRKTILTLITKRECAERCLFEREFNCLSASFVPSYKNNQARFGNLSSRNEPLGRCTLSDKDKTMQPDSFRTGLLDEEYIENQCIERVIENISCSYEFFSNSSFTVPEIKFLGLSQTECQTNCSNEKRFYCQGASYIPPMYQMLSECYLHSEELISMGPRGLQIKPNSLYLRRVKCLNVTVECKNEEMIITYTPDDWFRGKIYASSHLDDCSVDGNGEKPILLRLPIGNEEREAKCGIVKAYQVSDSYKRSFLTTLVVIQNNPNVQTQADRIIKVGCITKIPVDFIPNALALESNLNDNQTRLTSAKNRKNEIIMQIIDLNKQHETNEVQIGQNLQFNVIEYPINLNYDMQVTSLLATAKGQSFKVLDEIGCPNDPSIFPMPQKFIIDNKKYLQANFSAFKFAGTSLVSFDAVIKFCPIECPQPNCDISEPYNRRRKRNDNNFDGVKVQNTLYVASTSENRKLVANATDGPNLEVPLSLNISVHGPLTSEKDSLIYADNGVIIARDLNSYENVCINQSLLIALLIFAMLVQIILIFSCCYYMVKYKKLAASFDDRNSLHTIHENLSYIDGNRRVHWADNNGFVF